MSKVPAPVSNNEPCVGGLFHDFNNTEPFTPSKPEFIHGATYGNTGIQIAFRFCAHPECHAFQTMQRTGRLEFFGEKNADPWAVIDYKPKVRARGLSFGGEEVV